MKHESNSSKKAIVKLLVLSIIIIFSFNTTDAQLSPKWTRFSIEMQNKNILKLSWSVDHQNNNKEYIIQRSNDLKNWNDIGQIKNMSGENAADYSFSDKNLYDGMNYYRIQQKDINGNISYSVLKVIDNNASEWAYLAKKN
jgi:hypothetical protein